MCFVRISEQTGTFALYIINWLVFITVVGSVYCAVRTDSLYKADYVSSLEVLKDEGVTPEVVRGRVKGCGKSTSYVTTNRFRQFVEKRQGLNLHPGDKS